MVFLAIKYTIKEEFHNKMNTLSLELARTTETGF